GLAARLQAPDLALRTRRRAARRRDARARPLAAREDAGLAGRADGAPAPPRRDAGTVVSRALGRAPPPRRHRLGRAAGELAAARQGAAARQPARLRRGRSRALEA